MHNPELTKNFWLEFSTSKALITLVILAGVFLIGYLASDSMPDVFDSFYGISIAGMAVFIFVWGTKKSADAVVEEFNDHTWDDQRLTLLSPWQMTIGKLFGVPAFTWLGGGICLVIFLITSVYVHDFFTAIKSVLLILSSAIALHAFVMSLTLMDIRKNRLIKKMNSSVYFILGIFLAFFLLIQPMLGILDSIFLNKNVLKWYFFAMDPLSAMLIVSLFLVGWSILALYRNFRLELHKKRNPYYWMIFIVMSSLFFAGFVHSMNYPNTHFIVIRSLFMAFIINTTGFYISLFFEDKYLITLKERVAEIKSRKLNEFFINQPLYLFNIAFGLVLAIAILLYTFMFASGAKEKQLFDSEISIWTALSAILFMLRDLFFILFVNMSKAKRPDLSGFIYLSSLYLIPSFLLIVTDSELAFGLVAPYLSLNFNSGFLIIWGLISPLVQAVIMFAILKNRYIKISN